MTTDDINTVVSEYGLPVGFETEDTDGYFYQFGETDLFVADDVGELFYMALKFLKLHEELTEREKMQRG